MTGPRSFSFTKDGGNQALSFSCNRDWSISSTESWIKISPSSGTTSDGDITVTITCSPNTTYDQRSATITVIVEELMETISVTQDTGLGLIVSQTTYNLSQEEQTLEVDVQSNVDYSVSIDPTCKDWVSLESTKALSTGELFFRVAANDAYDKREGAISIKQNNGELESTIHINQKARNIVFADKLVEELLVSFFDDDVDGGISMEEAKAVKELPGFLCTQIESFDEMQFFTGISQIPGAAFLGCYQLKSVTLPETIIEIQKNAFLGCSALEHINLPSQLKIIGDGAFQSCILLESVDLPDGLTDLGVTAFGNCQSIKTLKIPASLQNMALGIFYNCTGLESVIISDGIKIISRGAFNECRKLSTVELPDSVTSIDQDAFFNCNLSTIIIPKNVGYIGPAAFAIPYAERIVVYGEDPAYLNGNPFTSTSCPIYVPVKCVEKYKTTDCWLQYAERILPMSE